MTTLKCWVPEKKCTTKVDCCIGDCKKFLFKCNKTFLGGGFLQFSIKYTYDFVRPCTSTDDANFRYDYTIFVEPNKKLNYCVCIPNTETIRCDTYIITFRYSGLRSSSCNEGKPDIQNFYAIIDKNICDLIDSRCVTFKMENYEIPIK
jgi:hypothetical protein